MFKKIDFYIIYYNSNRNILIDNFLKMNTQDIDDFPAPISSINIVLIDDGKYDFINFKKSIEEDESIDEDMKKILIQSRLDEINKFEVKSISNIEKISRTCLISILIVKLKNLNYNKIDSCKKKFILEQIDKWIDGFINKIILDTDTLYEINELLDIIKNEKSDFNYTVIKNIFEPKNIDDYLCYIDMMEIKKNKSIQEEKEKINKNNIVKIRKELFEPLIFNLNKLSSIDDETKILKEIVMNPITSYINLEKEFIEFEDHKDNSKLINFINSIRINKENKENIINLIKNNY